MLKRMLVWSLLLLTFVAGARLAAASGTHYASPHPAQLALHVLWTRSIHPNADSVAAYARSVRLPDGSRRALVYTLAGNNSDNCDTGNPVRTATLYALDATDGSIRWQRSTSGRSRCTTSAPAVTGGWVYAAGLDGRLHRYAAGTGAEYRRQGWPHRVTLMPDVEKVSANVVATSRYVYTATSGFIGDQGHYEGHLVTVDLRTGKQTVFNSLCSNIPTLLGPTPGQANYCKHQQSGLFGRGQAALDPVDHTVYVVSGNGPWNGHTNWGDSVLKLDLSGSRLLDAFTPTNQAALNQSDADLGSTGPAVLPPIAIAGHTYHLLVQGGKGPACDSCQGVALRLLNRDNLSGKGGPGHLGGDLADVQAPGACEILTAPAVWTSPAGVSTIIYANDCGLAGYRVRVRATVHGSFKLDRIWSTSQGGSTPVVKDGVVYVAGKGRLSAYDAARGRLLWQGIVPDIHWQYPLIAAGRIFLADQNGELRAYALPVIRRG